MQIDMAIIVSAIIDALWQNLKTIIGTAIGATLTFLTSKVLDYLRFRRFRIVFGRDIHSASDIILSVPLWATKQSSERRPRYQRMDPHGNAHERYGPSRMLAQDDVRGASLLISLVAEMFNASASMSADTENTSFTGKTVILIGSPNVNFHAAELLNLREGTPLPITFVEQAINEGEGEKARLVIVNTKSKVEYKEGEYVSYAAIVRAKHSNDVGERFYFYFVAGINSSGTWAACKYLHDNWKSLSGKPGEFGLVLKIAPAMPNLIAEVIDTA